MIIRLLMIGAFLSVASACFAQNTLAFTAPKDAEQEDLQKAAKAMQARCTTYGYKGVKGEVSDGEISLTCKTGFTKEMKERVKQFTVLKGERFELLERRNLTNVEEEQFKPGKNCPDGTKWVSSIGPDGKVSNSNTLLIKQATVSGGDWSSPKLGDFRDDDHSPKKTKHTYWEIGKKATTRLRKIYKNNGNVMLVIDGYALAFNQYSNLRWWDGFSHDQIHGLIGPLEFKDGVTRNGKGLAKAKWRTNSKILESIIKHPMPFTLEMKQ